MSTKTTFKRIALVAVAALGLGVLSVVPSQATVSGLTVSTPTLGSVLAGGSKTDSTTASTFSVSALFDAGLADTVTVSFVQNGDYPAGALVRPVIAFLETTTSSASQIDTSTVQIGTGGDLVTAFAATESISASTGVYSISRSGAGYAGAKFALFLESATASGNRPAGDYNFTIIVKQYSGGVAAPVSTNYPAKITVAAAAAAAAPVAGAATAYLQQGTLAVNGFAGVLADSVTTGLLTAASQAGTIQVRNQSAAGVYAKDTITVSMTGVGYLTYGASVVGRNFVIANVESATINVLADGNSGTGTITITTVAGASFVKTVSFYDIKPSKAVATVSKAYIKAGTAEVKEVFLVAVTDAAGTPVTNAVVTATVTDTATTVGGAATCETTYDATDKGFYCHVKGLSATKFGPVAYTIKATGTDTAKTVVTTSATVTFADVVATKAVLAGPASGTPGASVEYTITLTEKNGYPVADEIYGAGTEATGGDLFSKAVVSGWTAAPFAATESWTSVSGVITSKGTLPVAGTATGTWTLVGDGLQTLAGDAIDKTIGKTTLTVTTVVANAAADAATAATAAAEAATAASEAAEAAAQDATDAALDATTAAEAAGALAQEAVDAVAELSAEVTKLMAGVKAQITYLTKLVMRLAAK